MLQQFTASLAPIPLIGAKSRPTGIMPGTLIRTAEGELPVEYLLAGDRIETVNHGLVELRGTSLVEARGIDVVRIAPAALGSITQRPARDLVVPVNQQILVRDWRAQILHGQDSMLTPASSLVDDLLVTRQTVERVRLIRLHFDVPQVLWADGVQIASARTRAPVARSTGLLH